jgi:uncharacterized membrane protein
MRAFLATTCVVFALLTGVHIWRLVAESGSTARDPWFLLITVIAAALAVWAGLLLRRSSRSS